MSLKYCGTAFAAVFFCAASAMAAPPLEAYGRLPTLSDVELSPDGTKVALVVGDEHERIVLIEELFAKDPLAGIKIGDQKLRGLQWADNHHLIITTSVTALPLGLTGRRHEFEMAQVFDLATKSSYRLPGDFGSRGPTKEVMNVIAGTPEPRIADGHTMVFVPGIYFPSRRSRLALFRTDLSSGLTSMVSANSDTHAEDWLINSTGSIVAESDYYENDQRWKLQIFRDGDPNKAMDVPAPIEGPEIEGLSEDGTSIVIRRPQDDGTYTYEQASLKDGSITPWLRADLHLAEVFEDNNTGRVIGGPRYTDKTDYVFFDPHANAAWRSTKAAFSGATNVDLVSHSADWNRMIVLVFGGGYGDGYFYVDMATHKASPIGNEYQGIDTVAPVKWIAYQAGDGRTIQAYLTLPLGLPAGSEPKNLPLIVLPHGGPHARDNPGFDWLSQAFASRGYAVLQPEFRGSDGFGWDLLSAGFGEFGKKMQTDLSDGVQALAAQGLIDPKRVCIVGASYGGYAALAGATLQSGIYRCAVSIAGLSDLRAQLSYWKWPKNTLDDRSNRFWDRFLGIKDLDDPKLDALSPIKHVDQVSIPILLIHGRDDTVVPFSESDDMAEALKDAGKQVEFVKLDGEDHWLSRSETRLEMLEATVKFLETNNPPN